MTKHATRKKQRFQFAAAVAGCAILGTSLGVGLAYGLMALGVNL